MYAVMLTKMAQGSSFVPVPVPACVPDLLLKRGSAE
jgi:hypothetical protein